MKKNRIIAGLSAIMMGATMMAGTAMSASATNVSGTNLDGSFYCYYYLNGTYGLYPAPFNMDDANISAITYDSNTSKYTLTLTSAVYDNGAAGYISDIEDANGDSVVTSFSGDMATSADLYADGVYSLSLVPTSGNFGQGMTNPITVYFKVV